MPAQVWTAPADLVQPIVDGTALANSTTLTDISPANEPTQPAYWWQKPGVGSLFIMAWGEYSTTGTPNLTIGLYYGGVAGVKLADTGTVVTISAASHQPWFMCATVVCRTVGSSGTAFTQGFVTGILTGGAVSQMTCG